MLLRASAATLTTAWLAAAVILLPWAYRIAWDTPRAVPLVLIAPALWFGRDFITRRLTRLFAARSRLLWCATLLAAATIFSLVASTHWAASLTTAAAWCVFALAAILIAELLTAAPGAAQWLFGAMAASFALGTAIHWLRWKTGGSFETAFYVHLRLMGLQALGGALAAVAMVLHTWQRPGAQRFAWLAIGIVAWGGLLWTGSRSPLVGLAAGLLVWALKASWRERLRLGLATGILCAGGMLLSRAFWMDAAGLGWWHVARRSALTQSAAQLTSNRSSFWADSLQHAKASPLIGYGPDAYGFLTPQLEGAQPHNLVLQLVLDVGVLGAGAALILIAGCLWRGWRRPAADVLTTAFLALAVSCVASAQFDGYFYYPLAAIAGWLALGACAAGDASPATATRNGVAAAGLARAWPWVAASASAILLLNCWLFHRTVHGAPPDRPDALAVRLWRAFPSVTFNVDNWIEAWARRFPDDALAASLLARRHSQSPEIFRVQTARLLASRGDYAAAIAELERALYEARPEQRPAIALWLRRIRARASGR